MALVDGQNLSVLRFSNTVANMGEGPMELHGAPQFPPSTVFDVSQWVYDDTAWVTAAQRVDLTRRVQCAVYKDPTQ